MIERITGILKYSTATAMSIMLLGLMAFQLLPDMLLGIFAPSEEFLRIGRSALRIISISFPLAAIGISVEASFPAMGNGGYAAITALCRQLIVLLPVAYLMSLTGEVNAVWWAFPIAEVISVTINLLLYRRIYVKKIRPLKG